VSATRRPQTRIWPALTAALLALVAAACGGTVQSGASAQPVVLEHVPGTQTTRITLSAPEARRLEIRTARVEKSGTHLVIPYAAVLYSATGRAWAYVSTRVRTYERRPIVVTRVDGDRALLASGPPAGARVVAAGAMELFAAERAPGVPRAGSASAAPDREITAKDFDARAFSHSERIDNVWLPYRPGTEFVFTGSSSDGAKRQIFIVTDLVKMVGGVRSLVLWDRDYTDGELVEAELAFFAQDDAGNVWHTGEYPEEYENGKIVKTSAWLAGLDGATAGIEMKTQPRLGAPSYAQGFAPPPVSWNDRAVVYRAGQKTCVPYRCYPNVLITREFNKDEPGASQLKYYAHDVGNVRVGWLGAKNTDHEALKLVSIVRLGPRELARARAEALKIEQRAYTRDKALYGRTAPAERIR
jgi:hypothetical protein